jgi:hypothetical protein
MSATWYIAFGLLAALGLLNTLFLVSALRQIGELYQLRSDSSPGDQREPAPLSDRLVQAPILYPVSDPDGEPAFPVFTDDRVTILTYVAPGCTACEEVPSMLAELASGEALDDVRAVLVTDVSEADALTFLEQHRPAVPFLRAEGLAAYLGIGVSPYAIATRREESGEIRLIAGNVIQRRSDLEGLLEFIASQNGDDRPPEEGSGPAAAPVEVINRGNGGRNATTTA